MRSLLRKSTVVTSHSRSHGSIWPARSRSSTRPSHLLRRRQAHRRGPPVHPHLWPRLPRALYPAVTGVLPDWQEGGEVREPAWAYQEVGCRDRLLYGRSSPKKRRQWKQLRKREYIQQYLKMKMAELWRTYEECTKLQERSLGLTKRLAALKL